MKLYQQHVCKNWRDILHPDCEIIIDGDRPAFQVASVAEKRTIKAIHKATGREKIFDTRTEFWGRNKNNEPSSGSWLSDRNVEQIAKGAKEFTKDDFDIEDIQTPTISKENMTKYLDNIIDKYKKHLGVNNVKVFVGRGRCFRYDLPLAQQYKSKRSESTTLRPLALNYCKETLLARDDATLIEGIEVDDVASWYLNESERIYKETGLIRYICVLEDKDNYQTSGFLFQPVKDPNHRPSAFDEFDTGLEFLYPEVFHIPDWKESVGTIEFKKDKCKPMGFHLLHEHLLLGDYDTDGFSPLKTLKKNVLKKTPRYGAKTFYKEAVQCKTVKECLEHIKSKYIEWFGERIQYTAHDGTEQDLAWHEYLELIFKCAYMQRWEGDTTTIYDLFTEYGVSWED